ncbi:MAG: ADP-forming succinate--CoA ligase subunit beta [Candidatus Tectomicrobia bacterium]|nr:ADP-forming succinate--CoA ligase subunit beta [Candidatus Tectomicrobia bacterium]
MKIHEYQAKELLAKHGVPIPRGKVASSPEEARRIAEELNSSVVVKAQIHAGGRGKGGGIKLANSPKEAEERAREILGMTLVTPQTGPEGRVVQKVLVEEGAEIAKELYLGIVIDRVSISPVVIASEAGGMEIEEVAATSPEKVLREVIDPLIGLKPFQARKLAYGLSLDQSLIRPVSAIITGLYSAFKANDCSLLEINPLVVTKDQRVIALDTKMNIDDNALYRHKEIQALRDLNEEEPLEIEASKSNLSYIKLDGNIGCIVNGAGLAMATMDIVKLAGAEPANFLDVGGGASAEAVESAFRILLSDKHVKAVLINVFGGILRCDVFAQGVVQAVSNVKVTLPIVVRMEGTNIEAGRKILEESGLNFTVATGMRDAAEKVVAAIGG